MMPTKQFIIKTLSLALLVPSTLAFCQESAESEPSWVGIVAADSDVRCGANDSYYSVATAKKGDMVLVLGKRQGWMKISTIGNVFEQSVGYIKHPRSDVGVFEIQGGVGIANGDIEVLAKNIESEELYRSWRPVSRLQSGEQIEIIDTTTTEPGTLHREAYVVHTVGLPETSIVWISSSNIVRANEKQTAMFYGVDFDESTGSSYVTHNAPTEPEDCEDDFVDDYIGEGVVVETKNEIALQPLSLVELEATWDKMATEPVMGAEVMQVQDMYTELLSKNSDDLVIQQIATNRIQQLKVWAGLQEQRRRIIWLRDKLVQGSEDVSEYRSVVSMYGDYALVGTLALSNTFDGRLRPFMYRIQDAKSGRTLGYLPENEDLELASLVGQSVGIVGKSQWNPNWRVNVVQASRFDILSPTTATVTPDIQ